ncbi:MAG: phosphoglucomutase/phosphomannomutase family protein, partial [Mycobacteriales bacterium]
MTGNPIKFGTDGWRAIIADEFTFANVRYCAQGTAEYVKRAGMASRGMVVGYDTRFASEAFAEAVAEVFAANGVPVHLCDRFAPTPVIGYAILTHQAAGSVVITSSHNPAAYSGFKVRTETGASAAPEVLAQIESRIDEVYGKDVSRMPLAEAKAQGLVTMIDPRTPYLTHLADLVDIDRLKDASLRVIVDPMYGAGAGYISELLEGGKTQVNEIRGEVNPAFPGMHNPEPIAKNLTQLLEIMKAGKSDLGIANDGDADRVGIVDEK